VPDIGVFIHHRWYAVVCPSLTQLKSWVTARHQKMSDGAVVEAINPHGMALTPSPSPNIHKVIHNLHMLWIGVWMCQHAIAAPLVGLDWGCQLKSWVTSKRQKIKSLNPYEMAHTSTPNITRWLTTFICCGWGYRCVTMSLPSHLLAQIWEVRLYPGHCCDYGGCKMMQRCSGWGSKPTWNGSHILSKHILGDWQHSYDVDRDMDVSSCCYE